MLLDVQHLEAALRERELEVVTLQRQIEERRLKGVSRVQVFAQTMTAAARDQVSSMTMVRKRT